MDPHFEMNKIEENSFDPYCYRFGHDKKIGLGIYLAHILLDLASRCLREFIEIVTASKSLFQNFLGLKEEITCNRKYGELGQNEWNQMMSKCSHDHKR